jgi:outer membrane lipoprotein-sorting protein
MKTIKKIHCLLFSILGLLVQGNGYAQNATDIVRKADEKFEGEISSQSEMTMKIVRPAWERTVTFRNWSKGRDKALTLVTFPAKEKGQTFLKLGNDMWNWNPSINRMIKLPASMMSQGWMGSDFSNDDVLKESSLVVDYTHILKGTEMIENYDCYIIELIPKSEAAVVWGKIVMWISKEYFQLKSEYYDEDGYLVKTETAYDIKKMDDREIPTRFIIQPAEEKGNQTIVTMNSVRFNQPIQDNFFSQQNMKSIR